MTIKRILPSILILLCGLQAAAQDDAPKERSLPKLSAEEIVSKHVASIGAENTLAAVKSRVMVGAGAFTAKNTAGKVGGPAQLATSGDKFVLAVLLNSNNYPYEKFGYDGKDLTTGVLPSGGISPLGDFLKSHKALVKRGLLGGVLSQAWPLLKSEMSVKLESGGTPKIGNRNLYKLKLSSAGLGDMTVSLYFEPDTFRHVRTEYFYRTGQLTTPNPNRPGQIGGTSPSTYTLTEDFSDFTKVEDLVLPLGYQLEYTTDTGRSLTWTIKFSQVYNDQSIEESAFRVS